MQRIRCVVVLMVLLLTCLSTNAAFAACPLRDAAIKARQHAEEVRAEYLKMKLDPDLAVKLDEFHRKYGWLNEKLDLDEITRIRKDVFKDHELKRIKPYFDAMKANDIAEREARKAEKAFYDEFNKKDQALTKAEENFRTEQTWLDEQRRDLEGKPVDDPYLLRAAIIVYRLKNSYTEMIESLKTYRECYPDARAFIEDLERRLKRLGILEKEIADRRAERDRLAKGPPTVPAGPATAPVAGTGFDPANDAKKLGDWWVCEGPKTEPFGEISVSDKGMTWTRKGDGKEGVAKVTVTTAPPLRLRAGQAVKVVFNVDHTPPAGVLSGWYTNNFSVGDPLPDYDPGATAPPDPNSKKKGPPNVAVFHAVFAPHNPDYPVWIEVRANQPGEWVPSGKITWLYRKEGAK